MRPSYLRIGIVLSLLGAACGSSSGSSSQTHLKGFWYLPSVPTTRGTFTADLSVSGESVTGTLALVGHPRLGTLQVNGSYHEGYSGGVWNGNLDFHDAGQATFSFLVPGGGRIDNRSIASGTFSETGQAEQFYVYVVPAAMGVFEPTGAIQVSGTGLRGLAASSDGTTFWADMAPQGGTPAITTITNGTADPVTRALPSDSGRLLAWWNGWLWFTNNSNSATINGYSPDDFAQTANTLIFASAPGSLFSGAPGAVAFTSDAIWGLVATSYVNYEFVAWDKDGLNPDVKFTGTDLYSLAWCNGHLVTMQTDRNGYIDSILVSSSPVSNQFKAYPAPMQDPAALACSGSTLYVATSNGWIFQIPISQVTSP